MIKTNILLFFSLCTIPQSQIMPSNGNSVILASAHQTTNKLDLTQQDLSDKKKRTFACIAKQKRKNLKPLIIAQIITTNEFGQENCFYYEATRFNNIFFGTKNNQTITDNVSGPIYDPFSNQMMHRISYFGLPFISQHGYLAAQEISFINFSAVQYLLSTNAENANIKRSIIDSLVILPYSSANFMAQGIRSRL